MSDNGRILDHPDAVQANCQLCEWASPRLTVVYSQPNALWTARSTVTRLYRLHADSEHRVPPPRIAHLLDDKAATRE